MGLSWTGYGDRNAKGHTVSERCPDHGEDTEPCRRAYSREEMIEEAKAYMCETWGPCRESEDRDKWHERLGMLVDFIHDRFPANMKVEAPQ